MNKNLTIKKIDNINGFKLDYALEQKLIDLEWRIQSKKFSELFAQISAETIKGIGISWSSPFHPYAKYIDVLANDSSFELMNHLLAATDTHDKIILSCWDHELEKIQLLKQFQFKLFRKTYIETYEISSLLKRLEQEQSTQTLIPLLEILNEPTLEQNLFKLLKYNYEQTHLDNPAKDVTWQTWKEILLDDTPDFNLSFVTVEENNVMAYIFLHPISPDHYEIGWVGMNNHTNLLPILKQQLIQLQRQGVKTVEFEIDTTNHMSWQFAALLQLEKKKSWNSYYVETM
ncbi:hypothetical protein DCE79_12075 [Lysinibacillus sp. 2017]|uniref:hypothetical protein n=1 Tax=unclassified Lysinibacillus TaxID=2636778 RepID=UPI000D529DD6|nr:MULTISPECIES: hypothetical protein [unclassified Lysinibacillus]AWE08079.1 hypothetical protein DCE79_12075 [Lysinibacillus sp. 2017]TGN36417.1 hypothetical protein E4L99_05870 [Lysinibacillus sp. S2017]